MRAALARRNASIMMNSSIRWWFVGGDVGCTTNTSSPRTFSSIFTNVSPSGNGLMVHLPKVAPMDLQIAWARGWFAVPLKIFTMISFGLRRKNRRRRRMKLQQDSNNQQGWRKLNFQL